jgi:hypothetical protein
MKLRILALTYRTFPAPLSRVRQATIEVLQRMNLTVVSKQPVRHGVARIRASGWSRKLSIELESRNDHGTRARILAREGIFFEDNVVSDLLAHVAILLEHEERLARLRASRDDAESTLIPGRRSAPAYAI